MILPLTSVLMPVYNAREYVASAIRSVAASTAPVELCFVDDGSADNVFHMVKGMLDGLGRACRRVKLETNTGYSNAMNKAARLATGEFLTFLDADDMQDPTRIEKQVGLMLSGDYTVVSCDTLTMGEDGITTGTRLSDGVELEVIFTGGKTRPERASKMMRRELYHSMGGMDEDKDVVFAADLDLELRLLDAGHKFGHVREPLYWRRLHPNQVSLLEHDKQLAAGKFVRERFLREHQP